LRAPDHTRHRLSAALACIGAIAVLLGVPLVYAGHVLSDTEEFSARATSLLAEPSVRSLIAARVADEAVSSEHIPTLFEPVVDRAVDVAIGSPAFRPIFEAAVVDLHRSVFEQGSDTVTLRLAHVGTLVQDALRRISPSLAARIPKSATNRVTEISGGDFGEATRFARAIEGAHAVGVVLLVAGGLVFLLAILQAGGDRRRAARYVGIAILVDGLLLLAAYAVLRPLVLDQFAAGNDRSAAAAVWDAFVEGLRSNAVWLAIAGAVVAALMWAARARRPSAGGGGARAPARPVPPRSRPGRSAGRP
jgi:hypothetical protein